MALHDLSVLFDVEVGGVIALDSPLFLNTRFDIDTNVNLAASVDWGASVSFELMIQLAIESGRSRKLLSLAQTAEVGRRVELYTLDATSVGGDALRFCPYSDNGYPILWQGEIYQPFEMQTEGWEWSGRGPLPQPTIRFSNVNLIIGATAITYDDLLGATLTRVRTFDRFLDNGSDPDPDAYWPPDVYRLDQKTAQNNTFIEWKLASAIDQENVFLPSRQILKNACRLRYRRYDGSGFDYTNVTCPYVGTNHFNATGDAVQPPQEDACGKKFSDCKKRFSPDPLPFGGFPGVDQYRRS